MGRELAERQHPFQGEFGVPFDVVRHGDLVVDLAFQQPVQHPKQVGRVDAVHGGTGAGHRVQAEHGFIRVVDRQPVDQAKLSTDPPFATRRGQIDLFPDEFNRANPARCLDGLHGTFRVDNYVDIGVEGPSRVDLAGREPGMYRAIPLPQDHLGIAELLRSISTQLAERIPDH